MLLPARLGLSFVVFVGGGALAGCGGDVGEPGQGTHSSRSSGAAGDDEEEDGDAGAAVSKMSLGESGCTADDDCESGVCFKGNSQSFCTVRCTIDDAPSTCVAPLTGSCNKQGFCKRN